MVFEHHAADICEERGEQRGQTSEKDIVYTVRREEVCEYAADIERGHAFGKEEWQNGKCFGRPYLKRPVGKPAAEAEEPRYNGIQRCDDACAANHLGVPMRKVVRNAFE